MISGLVGYGSSNGGVWNAGDERVKQILANVAKEQQTTANTPGVSDSYSSPYSSVPALTPVQVNGGNFLAQAVGHDPADHVLQADCFIGCTFFIAADYLQIFAPSEIESWSSTIRKLGGQVDQVYSPQVTHVLCSTQFLDSAQAALADFRRVVTAYWLADAIKTKSMCPPYRAIHLPCPFMPPAYPLSNLLVTLTGLTGADRMDARLLLASVGAIYTTHLTPRHTVLIAAKPCGAKYDSALKWNVPVVNASWLKDIYFGNLSALKLPVAEQYLVKTLSEDQDVDAGKLLNLHTADLVNVSHLFSPWKHYLKVSREAVKRRLDESQSSEDRHNILSTDLGNKDSFFSPTAKDTAVSKMANNSDGDGSAKIIVITGFSAKVSYDLARKARALGGAVLDSISDTCTHLVAPSIIFTPKFLAAFSCCRYVVAPEWIDASFMANSFLPESGFHLRDPSNERLYGCNLLLAHEKASKRDIFKNLSVFIAPTVQPRPSILRMLIATNGGTVLDKPPSTEELLPPSALSSADNMDTSSEEAAKTYHKPSTVVIANPADVPLFRDLYPLHVPIHSVEFILTACVRQELNFSNYVLTRS